MSMPSIDNEKKIEFKLEIEINSNKNNIFTI